ncbi:MAG: beta-ketoacyl-ACP synthase II [bacterium]
MRRVVITGIGIISPIGSTLEEYFNSLVNGKGAGGIVTHFDPSEFSSKVACEVKDFDPTKYMDAKEAKRMDRFVQFGIAATVMAVNDSGIDLDKYDPFRVGVNIGSGIGGINTLEKEHTILVQSGPRRVSPLLIPMMIANMASGQVAMRYGIKGPNETVVTACATSTHAIGDSFRLIRHNYADVVIVGGAEAAITPIGYAGFCSMKAFSTRNDDPQRASRPFDAERDGFVIGEGAGTFILEELESAKRRGAKIYAEIVGYGATADAYHITAPDPDGIGASKAMEYAIKDANVSLDEIDYINAHGTSTKLNDAIETKAIKTLFGERAYKIAINSTKSMVGHLLGAAGAVESIAVVLCMKNNVVHPTINYEFRDPECDLDYTPNKPKEMSVNYALSNSFAFGGQNASLLFKKFA